MTERELVGLLAAGDRTAVAKLLAAHEVPLLRYSMILLGDPGLAQDAVQEAFLRLLREGERLRGVKALFPWLLQVTRNICHDLRRKETRMERRHEAAAVMEPRLEGAGADARAIDGELRERVHAVVAELSEKQREVLRLKLWEGLTSREIAQRLDMTLTNVGYHLSQAIKVVRVKLRDAGLMGDENRRVL